MKRITIRSFILLSVIIAVYFINTKTDLFSTYKIEPNIKWETDYDGLKLSENELELIINFLKKNDTKKFLVVRNNKIIFEWYSDEYNANSRHFTASLAKSLIGSLALLLVLQDSLLSVNDYAYKYIPHWEEDSLKSLIKIKHLASHTSGLEDAREKKDENYYELKGWKGRYWREEENRFHISLNEVPVLSKPGTVLEYSNPGITCLSYIISKVLHENNRPALKEYFREKLIKPLGIPDTDWDMSYEESFSYNGLKLFVIGGGGTFTARAAAKIGQLMLDYGNINGKQIIDSNLVARAIRFTNHSFPDNPAEIPLPGLGWWTNHNKIWKKLPENAFLGWGSRNQVVLGIPDKELVIVRFGEFDEQKYPGIEWQNTDEFFINPIIDFFMTEFY